MIYNEIMVRKNKLIKLGTIWTGVNFVPRDKSDCSPYCTQKQTSGRLGYNMDLVRMNSNHFTRANQKFWRQPVSNRPVCWNSQTLLQGQCNLLTFKTNFRNCCKSFCKVTVTVKVAYCLWNCLTIILC